MFHVGSARTALFNWLFARHHDGAFVLRIEDTDESRNQPEWVDGIVSALRWLELDWDEGPLFQSELAARHLEAAARLLAGGRAYYCDCTTEARAARAQARGGPPGYDGYCRQRELGPGPDRALRFRTSDEGVTEVHDLVRGDVAFPNINIEDFVIVKSNGRPTFVLANAVDDRDMAITHVVRGEEHLPNTPKAILLWDALGAGPPPAFAHLPLLVNEARKKLSKRRDRVALESFRDEGYLMEALRNYLCLLGWSPGADREVLTLGEMIADFRLEDVVNSPAFFDVKKLTAFNERYLRALDRDEFVRRCQPFLTSGPWAPEAFDPSTFRRAVPLIQERVKTLAEVPLMVDFFFLPAPVIDPGSWAKAVASVDDAAAVLAEARAAYATCEWIAGSLHDVTRAIADARGLALAKAQAPIRVAVTGRTVGPPLFESLEILGRERTLERLAAAQERIAAA
jgi:glutamyl-tRNA synthetase